MTEDEAPKVVKQKPVIVSKLFDMETGRLLAEAKLTPLYVGCVEDDNAVVRQQGWWVEIDNRVDKSTQLSRLSHCTEEKARRAVHCLMSQINPQ
jgi:hypothetical protein